MKVFHFLIWVIILALLLCILVIGAAVLVPEWVPEPVMQWLESTSVEVMDAYGHIISGVVDKITDSVQLPKGMLERLHAKSELIQGAVANMLEDSGITGGEYTFDTVYYPYYGFLTKEERSLYCQIYANVTAMQTTFIPEVAVTTANVENAVEAVIYDHPELFWLEMSYGCRYTPEGNCVQVSMEFNATAAYIDEARSRFDSSAEKIIAGAQKLGSDYEKEKYVHDQLMAAIDYDTDAILNQSAYSALVIGESVCAGYARAFQYIMTRLEIPTYYCVGYSEGDHAWNIVKLSDGYYNVDVTWDDTNASYRFFNCTDADYASTHTRDHQSTYLPDCTAVAYRG